MKKRVNGRKGSLPSSRLGSVEKEEKKLLEKFHEELMKLPPAERAELLKRYDSRFVEGMARSYLSDVKVLGREEAGKRLSQVVKNPVDLNLIISRAKKIEAKKD